VGGLGFGARRSLAHGDPLLDGAVLALDEAAPVELAAAPFGPALAHDVVATSAAEGSASVAPRARPVAPAPGGAGDVRLGVALAKVGRLLEEEELAREVLDLAALAPGPAASREARGAVPVLPLALLLAPVMLRAVPPPEAAHPVQRRHVPEVALGDGHRVPEAVLQGTPDYAEVRHNLPAGLELARARHAVALAAHLHVARHRLQVKVPGIVPVALRSRPGLGARPSAAASLFHRAERLIKHAVG
jgi:hypothetical protein